MNGLPMGGYVSDAPQNVINVTNFEVLVNLILIIVINSNIIVKTAAHKVGGIT